MRRATCTLGHDEIVCSASGHQDVAGRRANYPLGYASDEKLSDGGAPVRAEDEQVRLPLVSFVEDHPSRVAFANDHVPFDGRAPDFCQAFQDRLAGVAFALGDSPPWQLLAR